MCIFPGLISDYKICMDFDRIYGFSVFFFTAFIIFLKILQHFLDILFQSSLSKWFEALIKNTDMSLSKGYLPCTPLSTWVPSQCISAHGVKGPFSLRPWAGMLSLSVQNALKSLHHSLAGGPTSFLFTCALWYCRLAPIKTQWLMFCLFQPNSWRLLNVAVASGDLQITIGDCAVGRKFFL